MNESDVNDAVALATGSDAYDYVKCSTGSDPCKVVGFATEKDAGNAERFAMQTGADDAVRSATELDVDDAVKPATESDADKCRRSATETNADKVVQAGKATETIDLSGVWRGFAETVMRSGQDDARCRERASSRTAIFYKSVCLEGDPTVLEQPFRVPKTEYLHFRADVQAMMDMRALSSVRYRKLL